MEFVLHANSGNCNYMPLQSLRKLICLYFDLRQDANLLYNFVKTMAVKKTARTS
jgi:hypothetical protein